MLISPSGRGRPRTAASWRGWWWSRPAIKSELGGTVVELRVRRA